MPNSIDYENRLVLFMDILGFQKIVDKTENKGETITENVSNIYNAIHAMKGYVDKIQLGSSKQVTQFSDSVVLSFKLNDPKSLTDFFPSLLSLIIILITHKWLCRGALSYGKLYHDKETLFGPALVDAYTTESKAALYPRVIFDRSIIDLMDAAFKDSSSLKYSQFKSTLQGPIINRDTDDRLYLDYFTGILAGFNYRQIDRKEYLKHLRQIIVDGRRIRKPDIRIKYDWMKNKFNKFLNSIDDIVYNWELNDQEIINIPKTIKEIQ